MKLLGIHHLTAITADAPGNRRFYVETLGLRLVKKSVNQDDTSAYHLFYADGVATPGTDITFFDWPTGPERRGTHSISRTGFRVAGRATLDYWQDRLKAAGRSVGPVHETDGRLGFEFEDPEGQRLALIDDGGAGDAHPWEKSTVPAEHQLRGLGPITLSVPDIRPTEHVLKGVMEMEEVRSYGLKGGGSAEKVHVFKMAEGGPETELHVAVQSNLQPARQGAGGVHHVAFRTPNETEYSAWAERLNRMGLRNSGKVDRFYFQSLYFREPNGILFEIATDGPGFHADEPMEHLGERLALPPFLEPKRAEIEAKLKPL
ncbi:MAG: ring-cleaving dioxygenase [Bauldia sp.]|nr:ring-cleaving dioxygenase [Bauldia sp.]